MVDEQRGGVNPAQRQRGRILQPPQLAFRLPLVAHRAGQILDHLVQCPDPSGCRAVVRLPPLQEGEQCTGQTDEQAEYAR